MLKKLALFLLVFPFCIMGQTNEQNPHPFKKSTSEKKVIVQKVKANQKQAVVVPNYPTEAYLKANNVPDDFPRYHDTGNPKLDGARYHEAKQAWIKKNPKAFEKIKHLNL